MGGLARKSTFLGEVGEDEISDGSQDVLSYFPHRHLAEVGPPKTGREVVEKDSGEKGHECTESELLSKSIYEVYQVNYNFQPQLCLGLFSARKFPA